MHTFREYLTMMILWIIVVIYYYVNLAFVQFMYLMWQNASDAQTIFVVLLVK